MKKILCLLMVFVSTSAFAQDAAQLKEMSLQACASQVAQLPADQQEAAAATCKCTVENTDYEKMMSATQAGDIEAVKADAMLVAQQCVKTETAK